MLVYYAATAVFVVLDVALGFNVRVAFLEPYPAARLAYYGICFGCLAAIVRHPDRAEIIGAFESLVTLVALIVSMGLRTILVSETVLETGSGYLTLQEILNFLLSGSVAYLAWIRGLSRIQGQKYR